jgi:glyoxylase-like metal-dependent hydrolase (beta-lactamase superfamily II)
MNSRSVKLGQFELSIVSDGKFWLDGGTMFGVVPKVMWDKLNPADDLNRIELGLNCLLIQTPDNKILVDTGIGEKLKERFKDIYRVERDFSLIEVLHRRGIEPEDIDKVISTHLHFDHCGGNTVKKGGKSVPTFPNAQYIIQRQEWYDATHPNERTKASYLKENFVPLEENAQLLLVDGEQEVSKGVKVIVTNGHTQGHQSVLIESDGIKAIYFGDLIPTTSHIKIPYVMGYDLYPLDIIKKKKDILQTALNEHWLLIFEHDPKTTFAYLIEKDGKQILEPIHNKNSKFQDPIASPR